jgi:hypothetical protein
MDAAAPPPYQPQAAPSMHFRIKSLWTSYHHHVHLVLITVLLALNFLSSSAWSAMATSAGARAIRLTCRVFSHDFHMMFTPCEVAAKSLVSDATYDGRRGRQHPCRERKGRCRNRTPTPRFHSGADIWRGTGGVCRSRTRRRASTLVFARRANPIEPKAVPRPSEELGPARTR